MTQVLRLKRWSAEQNKKKDRVRVYRKRRNEWQSKYDSLLHTYYTTQKEVSEYKRLQLNNRLHNIRNELNHLDHKIVSNQ